MHAFAAVPVPIDLGHQCPGERDKATGAWHANEADHRGQLNYAKGGKQPHHVSRDDDQFTHRLPSCSGSRPRQTNRASAEADTYTIHPRSPASTAACARRLLEPFRRAIAFGNMLRPVAGTLLFILIAPTCVLAAEEIKRDNVGPWEIEATFKNDKFDHCAISRTIDEVVARFVRTSDGLLSLVLESPNWKLERGKNYSVHMKAGAANWNTEVAAESTSVSVPISDKRFKDGLRAANTLVVEGAGATIRIPLDQSLAALERLDECLVKNSQAADTNPFVAPKRQP